MTSIYDCGVLQLPKVFNTAGSLTVLENGSRIPFDIKRLYYIYDVKSGQDRGAHAHKQLEQCIVAVSGAFEVLLDDGQQKKVFSLDRPNFGLHVKPGMWRRLFNFSGGAVCLVLASHPYNEADYIRDYDTFLDYAAKQ